MRTITLVTFLAVFLSALFVISTYGLPEPWMVLVLGLASSFGGRAVAYLTIFEWLRKPFATVVPHSSGAGESVEPRNDRGPIIQVIGEWLCCPVCAGTWVATGLLVTWTIAPNYGLLLMYILAAGAIGSTLTRYVEKTEWEGRHQWELTGYYNRLNKFEQRSVEPQYDIPVWIASYKDGGG